MSYQIKDFIIDDDKIYCNIIVRDKTITMNIPINDKVNLNELPNKYGCVTNAHIIDNQGVGIYQPRQWRPFVSLPEGVRQCEQWEFDRHCAENPDPRYTVDMNALVWNQFNKL